MFEHMKIRYLIALSFVSLFLLVVFTIGFGVSEEFFGTAANLVIYVFIPAIFFGYYFHHYPSTVRDVISIDGVRRWIPALIGIVLAGIALSLSTFWLLVYLVDPIFPSLVDFLMAEVPMPSSPFYLITEIAVITVLAPIIEEFVFRGVFLHRFMKKTSMWGGILISSILFGIMHADMIGAFLFGVIACLLYLRTGNLVLPILMHIFNNTFAVIMSYMPVSWSADFVILRREDIVDKAGTMAILLAISLAITVFIIIKLSRGLTKIRQEAAARLIEGGVE